MVVGDVVIGVGLVGTAFQFQPAAGVTLMCTMIASGSSNNWINYIDATGTLFTYLFRTGTTAENRLCKMFINNTTWLSISVPLAIEKASFCAIQIQ